MTNWKAYQIEALAIYNAKYKVNAVLWAGTIDFNAVDIAVEFSENGTAYVHKKSGVSYVKGAVLSFEHWQAIRQGREYERTGDIDVFSQGCKLTDLGI